jgi:bifunctional DNA-binding transcriptional regulator/antitoxin component of YhaV-PrlF toxin-antitoxin module
LPKREILLKVKVKVQKQGRFVIPEAFRIEMGNPAGLWLSLVKEDDKKRMELEAIEDGEAPDLRTKEGREQLPPRK